jgi:hypothetical protein
MWLTTMKREDGQRWLIQRRGGRSCSVRWRQVRIYRGEVKRFCDFIVETWNMILDDKYSYLFSHLLIKIWYLIYFFDKKIWYLLNYYFFVKSYLLSFLVICKKKNMFAMDCWTLIIGLQFGLYSNRYSNQKVSGFELQIIVSNSVSIIM